MAGIPWEKKWKWPLANTANTVASCRQVVILLKMEGVIFTSCLFKNKKSTPKRIRTSRVMTMTVNQGGIKFLTARTTKAAIRRNLSAIGSRKDPSLLF